VLLIKINNNMRGPGPFEHKNADNLPAHHPENVRHWGAKRGGDILRGGPTPADDAGCLAFIEEVGPDPFMRKAQDSGPSTAAAAKARQTVGSNGGDTSARRVNKSKSLTRCAHPHTRERKRLATRNSGNNGSDSDADTSGDDATVVATCTSSGDNVADREMSSKATHPSPAQCRRTRSPAGHPIPAQHRRTREQEHHTREKAFALLAALTTEQRGKAVRQHSAAIQAEVDTLRREGREWGEVNAFRCCRERGEIQDVVKQPLGQMWPHRDARTQQQLGRGCPELHETAALDRVDLAQRSCLGLLAFTVFLSKARRFIVPVPFWPSPRGTKKFALAICANTLGCWC
jgi:hypothetical protein